MAHHTKFHSINLSKPYNKSSSPSSASDHANGRPRSAGAIAHKPTSRLAVPPPVNLPSLRKENERLDPSFSKPSSGHGGSGIGIGGNSSMSWKFADKNCSSKTVILKGEDFPSLNATASFVSKQKQKQGGENSDKLVVDLSPKLRSLSLSKKNVEGSEGGLKKSNFSGFLPPVRARNASDWDDDERDRNHADHYDGDSNGKEFMRKEDHNVSSWRAMAEPKREVLSKGTGKESSHDRFSYGDRRVNEGSNFLQRGKSYTNSVNSKSAMSPSPCVFYFSKGKMSNGGRNYAEDAGWDEKDTFSSDAVLDLKAKVVRKKKEVVKETDFFDPARESFEAELVRVVRLQDQERQRLMDEQARVMEVARKEAEERERIVREEEERRQLFEEEEREAAWRAEQEKLDVARRAEENRIAREEEKKRIFMEEERRKEGARQKLLELEAKIASRQIEANANDRVKERNSLRDETIAEHLANSPSFDSSRVNRSHTSSSVENHSFGNFEKKENNWNNANNSNVKFQDQDWDGFGSNRNFHRKQLQGIHGPKPITPSFKRGNRDCDQFNERSNIDAMIGGWDNGHFDGSPLDSYSERSFQNSEVDDIASFSRVRHTVRQPRVPPPPPVLSSIHKNSRGDGDARINQTCREEESHVEIVYYHQRIIEPGAEPRIPELMEETASSLLQTEEKNSPRYDSQSSLSISNPPSSPTQLSHDEFDDCEGSPALTTSAEEEIINFSESKSMIPEMDAGKTDAEIMPFSHGEDEDWAILDDEKMQEEDHDDGHDSNQEDNEAHESDAWELQLRNKLEDLNVVVEKPIESAHASYGIESHVQLGASDHYLFNKGSDYHENMSTNAEHVKDSVAQNIFADNSAGSLQLDETIPDKILNLSSEIVEETVKEQEDMIFHPVTTVDHPTDVIRTSKNSSQNPIAAVSRLPLPSTSSLCSISASVPSSSGQNDVPDKLQFGLFSSPPLIPSPLPTIQIGSIQTPLFLNTQIDSYSHMHPPYPPPFQIGQIAYTPATSQGVLPKAVQTSSYTHHSPLAHHRINGNTASFLKNQVSPDSTTTKGLDKEQPSSGITNRSRSNLDSEQPTALLDVRRDDPLISKRRITSAVSDEKDFHNLISHSSNSGAISNKNFRSMVYSKRIQGRPYVDSFSSARKSLAVLKAPRTMPDIRGNRLTYNARNAGSLSSFTRTENSYVNSNRPQRRVRRYNQGTEYRVKESGARQSQCTESFNHINYSGKLNSGDNLVGVPLRNVSKKGAVINKSTKLMNEEAVLSSSQVVGANSNMSTDNLPHGGEENLNKNGIFEDDIYAPLMSGIVRVFNQPGIEASSDGDGFVEVRSKRKISNERRGQRERESNPKHKATKVPHRHRATLSSNGTAYKSDVVTTLTSGAAAKSHRSDGAIVHRRPSSDLEVAKLTTTSMTCQKIAAIGSPDVNSADYDSKRNSLKSSRAGSDLAIANDGANAEPSLSFSNNIAFDNVSVPLGTWGTVHLNQQEVSSTQSQLDEASNPVQLNPVGAAKVSLDDKKHATTSVTKKNPSFPSVNLPNFPFDGEKIQFGAVVSPPPLPPSGQAGPSGIWSPGSVILSSSIIHNLPMNDNGERNFFVRENYPTESSTRLDDTEAEAEAAASAVAVAVITNDEITASTSAISGLGGKGLTCTGETSCIDTTCQSASKESLIVTLPSDLSVNTPLSLWPPLPTIQSSRPMLSDMAGPQPSPFPFFDSNPMLGGPILAFRAQDESSGTQAHQPQQSPTFISGPTGAWPQCHSGVESSFYGSPAGFAAPFMSPPAGLSGVHGHAPMVFYNHFAPIGQFGQVGLGYMGGAYLPAGKQPEWKHSSDGAATVNANKADPSNLNVFYGQQNPAHVPTSIQHLSTGSGVMQVTSPFTLFNLRPFQSSTEIQVPAQWPPIPHPHPPNSIRLSTAPEHFRSSPSDLPRPTAVNLPDELGLVEPSSSSNSINAQTLQSSRNHSTNTKNDSNDIIPNSAFGKADKPTVTSSSSSQKTPSGSQYGQRSTFHGKYVNNKSNKNIGSSKMKQIYVAKSLLTTQATSS